MKKEKKGQSRTGHSCGVIDIEKTYREMKEVLAKRYTLQQRQDALWAEIKRNHCDRSAEMEKISNGIGATTHKLNGLISELCRYKKTHKAMGLANQFITQEIQRITKIIQSTEWKIRCVENGQRILISDRGIETTNTRQLRKYVEGKKAQVQKLQTWKNHVSKYMA